ncbi:hypothetical protein AAHA92_17014 [Salvia divinorum]|uniref:Ribosomal protein L32 n=1 Tax=Salvia divinorum TaxID=28513 RepID=A0ABD1GXF2_SALDI
MSALRVRQIRQQKTKKGKNHRRLGLNVLEKFFKIELSKITPKVKKTKWIYNPSNKSTAKRNFSKTPNISITRQQIKKKKIELRKCSV